MITTTTHYWSCYQYPVGHAVEGLMNILNSLKSNQGGVIPKNIKSRLEYLISSPGEGSNHTVAILTRQVSWLYFLDPEWVKDRILPGLTLSTLHPNLLTYFFLRCIKRLIDPVRFVFCALSLTVLYRDASTGTDRHRSERLKQSKNSGC